MGEWLHLGGIEEGSGICLHTRQCVQSYNRVSAENKGSERVMQKNGLIKEAEHIDYEWHDGKMKTRLEYRLLKHEWEQLQKTL